MRQSAELGLKEVARGCSEMKTTAGTALSVFAMHALPREPWLQVSWKQLEGGFPPGKSLPFLLPCSALIHLSPFKVELPVLTLCSFLRQHAMDAIPSSKVYLVASVFTQFSSRAFTQHLSIDEMLCYLPSRDLIWISGIPRVFLSWAPLLFTVSTPHLPLPVAYCLSSSSRLWEGKWVSPELTSLGLDPTVTTSFETKGQRLHFWCHSFLKCVVGKNETCHWIVITHLRISEQLSRRRPTEVHAAIDMS